MSADKEFIERAYELQKTHDLFELLVEGIYRSFLRSGDHAIDGGCNVGRHTLPLAQVVGPSGIIVGFEPIPVLAARLSERANELPQLRIYNKAIAAAPGRTHFLWFPEKTGWSGLHRRADAENLRGEHIDVEITTIDQLPSSEVSKLRFIKLDIEGGELDALRGARETLARQRPLVVFENGESAAAKLYHYTMDEWYGFFDDCRYRLFDILGRPYPADAWNGKHLSAWNAIAVAEGSDAERFVLDTLPGLARSTMRACV